MNGLLERAAGFVLGFLIVWPIFRLILEAITLVNYALCMVFYGEPGPLADISIVLMLIRRYRNHKAREAARSRYTPPPEPDTVSAVLVEKRIKEKHYHGAKRPYLCYHAAFRLEDGREVWLSLSEAEYDRLSKGDQGILIFREKERIYLSFQSAEQDSQSPAIH